MNKPGCRTDQEPLLTSCVRGGNQLVPQALWTIQTLGCVTTATPTTESACRKGQSPFIRDLYRVSKSPVRGQVLGKWGAFIWWRWIHETANVGHGSLGKGEGLKGGLVSCLGQKENVTFDLVWWIGRGFPGGSVVKNPPANAGDAGNLCLILRSERFPGGRNGNPLQYSCLENSREAWWATVHGVAKSMWAHTPTDTHTHMHNLIERTLK